MREGPLAIEDRQLAQGDYRTRGDVRSRRTLRAAPAAPKEKCEVENNHNLGTCKFVNSYMVHMPWTVIDQG